MGGISIWQLLIIAVIVILLFGTKKLRNMGGDLGGAVKGFKKAMSDDESKKAETTEQKTLAEGAEQKPAVGEKAKDKEKV